MTAPVWVTLTATVSACAVTPARLSVNTAAVPSVTGLVPAAMVTSGRSSSVMVNFTSSGARATAVSDTVPDTFTCLSTVSTVSSSAVTVTAPVLSVAAAANVSTVLPLKV